MCSAAQRSAAQRSAAQRSTPHHAAQHHTQKRTHPSCCAAAAASVALTPARLFGVLCVVRGRVKNLGSARQGGVKQPPQTPVLGATDTTTTNQTHLVGGGGDGGACFVFLLFLE